MASPRAELLGDEEGVARLREVGLKEDPDDGRMPRLPERYEVLGLLGKGGMGEVWRVFDRDLRRTVAVKTLRMPSGGAAASARFKEEALITARLQHPGIVPVYELGQTEDGRPFLSMKIVEGATLKDVIRRMYRPQAAPPLPELGPLTLRRLVEVFLQVAEAVAFAHASHVLHRDLKPSNVMVGAFGEVLVMDWGLALALGEGAPAAPKEEVSGTPAYMAPEQARGETLQLGPPTDVWGLGAILYEILSDRPPYPLGAAGAEAVLAGPPPPPGRLVQAEETLLEGAAAPERREVPGLVAPVAGLVELCERMMQREPVLRPSAAQVGAAVRSWLDGEERRDRAAEQVRRARELEASRSASAERLELQRLAAARLRQGVPPWRPISEKRPLWALEAEVEDLRRRVLEQTLAVEEALRLALDHDPDHGEAHAMLAEQVRRAHATAELAGQHAEAARLEAALRRHDRARLHQPYLRGDGVLSIDTSPPGVEVELFRWQRQDLCLVPEPVGVLGRTPLVEVPLPMGRWLLRLRHPGRVDCVYPIRIEREGRWPPLPLPAGRRASVQLLPVDALGTDEVYVPAGPAFVGGDAEATNGLPGRWIWLDAFVMQRLPVTNGQYLGFINDLVQRGRRAEAERWLPRERAASSERWGAALFSLAADGRYELGRDADGDPWHPDEPVVMVDWACARAYAAWWAETRGVPWRLPWELEWEKAARGADGRPYPWGDHFDPTLCNSRESREGPPGICEAGAFVADRSPFGVGDLGGNVQDWCLDAFRPEGPPVNEDGRPEHREVDPGNVGLCVTRGGSWPTVARDCRSASRFSPRVTTRAPAIGFRLVRSLPEGR